MKNLFLLSLILGVTLCSEAQVRLGVKAGYNLSTLRYIGLVQLTNQKSQSGFNAGLLVSIPLSEYISLQPEASYSTQGTKYQIDTANAAYHYNYLNIPILIKYLHATGLFAETGFHIGFPLIAKNVVAGKSEDIKSKTYSPDYAWVAGLGYIMPETNLSIDIRYNLGLISITSPEGGDLTRVKNSVFQIDLIYLF